MRKKHFNSCQKPNRFINDNATTAEGKYSINIIKPRKKICLRVHYNESKNFLYTNVVKIYQFKASDSEIKAYPLCLGNISKDFTVDTTKKLG